MQKHPLNVPAGSAVQRAVYLAAFIGPLSAIPQIVEIWVTDHSAHGVSLLTWSLFLVMSVVWFWYGLAKRDVPLVISNGLWIIGEAIIIAGAIHYDFDFL